ncbi:MAG: MBOAT family protein [Lachnospiraceae bacterium]|nr:MBOAT family protein [Lachnospiraceae bacterium]
MIFSSLTFILLFLPGTFVLSRLVSAAGGRTAENALLLAVSLLFYAWGEPHYILLMLISIAANWCFGMLLDHGHSHEDIGKKGTENLITAASIAFNLGLLVYFKYANLLVMTFGSSHLRESWSEVHLPVGISFFTFQAMSYVIDVRRGICKTQRNPFKLALYISFFPQLIAGPIVKYSDIDEQIEGREMTRDAAVYGFRRFAYGLGKKVLLANALGSVADHIYAIPSYQRTWVMAWFAAIAYTFQIYYDFSGYSDMAIGLGSMFGFHFKENFLYPYTSVSVREFWRRWHISLSSWFRDYVYIPLGGNRKGAVKTYRNLFIVFCLTGIWHGASWTFLVWGLYHGFFIVMERALTGKYLSKVPAIGYIYTGLTVIVGWVIFRCETLGDAFSMIDCMFRPWKHLASPYSVWEWVDHRTILLFVCALLGMGVLQRCLEGTSVAKEGAGSRKEKVYLLLIALFSFLGIVADTYNPFLYFRF